MNQVAKSILKYALLIILAAYAVGMAIWANAEAKKNSCKGITVAVDGRGVSDSITLGSIRGKLLGYPRKIVGAPLTSINTLEIENYLKSLNNFEDVKCFITTSGYLSVRITPMIPEIRVFDGNKSYYLNKDGKRIPSNAEFFADVPVVAGRFSKRLSPALALPVVRFVQNDSVLRHLVAMVVVKDADNIMLIPRITGHVVNFGDTMRLGEKRKSLLTAYREIIPSRGWNYYDTISVRFRGQIVASRRDKAPLFPSEQIIEEADLEEATLPADTLPPH